MSSCRRKMFPEAPKEYNSGFKWIMLAKVSKYITLHQMLNIIIIHESYHNLHKNRSCNQLNKDLHSFVLVHLYSNFKKYLFLSELQIQHIS